MPDDGEKQRHGFRAQLDGKVQAAVAAIDRDVQRFAGALRADCLGDIVPAQRRLALDCEEAVATVDRIAVTDADHGRPGISEVDGRFRIVAGKLANDVEGEGGLTGDDDNGHQGQPEARFHSEYSIRANYSQRRAITGSTRVARHAGRKLAAAAITASSTVTPAKVSGSVAFTP